MDSLSQMVLGAAVGEAVLGKKIGNRAVAIGAIGGTIPDLDVIANPFLSPIQAMDFHRGISHSLLFSVVAPIILAAITFFFFKKEIHKQPKYRLGISLIPLLLLMFFSLTAAYAAYSVQAYWGLAVSLGILLLFSIPVIRYIRKEPANIEKPSYMNWYWFFFWTTLTHILLDAFTTYGTQIFMPFSNMRVAVGSISVVDPLYTFPFCFFIFILLFMRRTSRARRVVNWIGIGLSSLYLVWTLYNKTTMNEVVKNTLADQGIKYERFITSPSFSNNILWSATVETDSSYLVGAYSKFDPARKITRFKEYPKNHQLIKGHENDEHLVILRRFSDGYFIMRPGKDPSMIELADLRWGTLNNLANISEEDELPVVTTLKLVNGKYELFTAEEEKGSLTENLTKPFEIISQTTKKYPNALEEFWERIMGNRQ